MSVLINLTLLTAEGIVLSVTVSLLKYPAGWQTAENTGGAMLLKNPEAADAASVLLIQLYSGRSYSSSGLVNPA